MLKKIIARLGSREAFLFWTFTLAGFILFERAGLFRFEPASYREIFHSLSVRIMSIFFLLSAVAGAILSFTNGPKRIRLTDLIFCSGIGLLVVGLWVSYFTHFSGKVIRAEGQPFGAFLLEYVQPTVYRARYAKLPQVGIFPKKIHLATSADVRKMEKIAVDMDYSGRTTGGVLSGTLRRNWPFISDWTLIRLSDFGYAPKYELLDHKENTLEWNYTYLKLFPPGTEDSLRTQFLGYLFYLTLYPDFVEKDGKPGTRSAELRNPMYNLRVVRNKDIIYSGLMKPTEKLRFDDVVITFPDVKMWIEMTLMRDLGIPFAAAGCLMLIISPVLSITKRKVGESRG